MLIELDIEPNKNVDEYECRTFMSLNKPYLIKKTLYYPEEEEAFLVEIVGWEDGRQSNAYAILVEDSGDGEAWLIYGGNEGIRIRKSSDTTSKGQEFSLEHEYEWGEKYLYYNAKLYHEAIKPFLVL